MPVTELATFPLIAGIDVSNPSTQAGKTWEDIYRTVIRQDGFQHLVWGTELESPDVAQLFVDWDKIESHQAFMKSSDYEPMLEHLKTLLSGAPSLYHIEFSSAGGFTAATSAPVTEVATFYLDSKSSSFETNARKFEKVITEGSAEGLLGASSGWSVEDIEHEKLGAGNKGKAWVLVVGWQSKEAHIAFRETALFKENIGLLRDGPKGVEMHHVAFRAIN